MFGLTGWFGGKAAAGDGRASPPAAAHKWLPAIRQDYCTGCGCCVKACPRGALAMVWSFAKLTKPEACTGEGACVEACPEKLIAMEWRPAEGDRGVGRWREPGK